MKEIALRVGKDRDELYDIYQNSRYANFVMENGLRRVAIETDDEASHNKQLVSSGKFCDDLLKQNSMVYDSKRLESLFFTFVIRTHIMVVSSV